MYFCVDWKQQLSVVVVDRDSDIKNLTRVLIVL